MKEQLVGSREKDYDEKIISAFLILLPLLTGGEPILKPDTTINTSFLLTQYLYLERYDLFTQSHPSDNHAISYQLFTTLTFDNGNMIPVNFVPDPVDGKYPIQDIKLVPDEMKPLFE